jgi:hypothetical protein
MAVVKLHYFELGRGLPVVFLHGNATKLPDFSYQDLPASRLQIIGGVGHMVEHSGAWRNGCDRR